MVEFNVKETGDELLKILEDELTSKNSCRLTIDVLIPENLVGDKPGLCNSILMICKFLDRNISHLVIDIELLRVAQYPEAIQLNVEVKGSKADFNISDSMMPIHDNIEHLLRSLPYLTSYVESDIRARFNFKMTFQYEKDGKGKGDLFEDKIILLAEHSEISALTFIAFLEEWGCMVKHVVNGQHAIQEARKRKFDLILVDVHIPGIAGNEVISKIREFDEHVPLVAIATSSIKHASKSAREAGANNTISKPVDGNELQKMLTQYLRTERR